MAVVRSSEELNKYVNGYEIGWRRKDLSGVNAVIRIHWKKPIVKVD